MKLILKKVNKKLSQVRDSNDIWQIKQTQIMKTQTFARKCTATGELMNEGWYAEGNVSYFKYEADAVKYCKELGYESIDDAYEADEIYWTEWEEDHAYAIDNKGNVTEIY